MKPTAVNLRTPLIRFLGKRVHATSVDHTPRAHPLSPTGKLPPSYATSAPASAGVASSTSFAAALKYTPPGPGEYAAIKDLPARFRFKTLSDAEIDNINEGGAAVIF